MRKYVIIASLFASLLFVCACQREIGQEEVTGEGLRLTFTCGDIGTKAGKSGTGNENLLKTVDVFLFSDAYNEYRHHWRFTPGIEESFTCFIQAAVITDDTYKVFSIANYPGPETDFVIGGTEATLAQLQALALSESSHPTFTSASGASFAPAPNEDLCLVMTGMAENITIQVVPGKTLVGNAEIELKRLPAKVTMDFFLKDEVVHTKGDVTETWTPLTDGSNIRVYLCGAASDAFVGGRNSSSPIFDYLPNLDNTPITGKTDFSTAYSSASFYTYPESWSYGASNEPYIKLIVPWKLVRSTSGITQESQKEFYYKVMLPTNAFESNNWYHLILDVTQLGGDSEDDAVNVPCGYQILDWRTLSEISSSMAPGYYLDVNVPDMQNIRFYGNTLDIPYFASGKVAIKSRVKEWDDFSSGDHQTETNTPSVAIASEGDYIHITNILNYDFTSTNYDVSPYTFTIVLQLASDAIGQYDKTLVVTQYPPLYITNTDTRNNDNSKSNIYVNGYYTNSGSERAWDSVGPTTTGTIGSAHYAHYLGHVNANTEAIPTSGSGTNVNPNIYSVTTTILKFAPIVDGQPFETVLGDPRAAATDEYSGILTGTITGDDLKGYRPTGDNTQNVISPKFISASSYGKTYAVSYEGARKRCAAYQEYGYPAGRWRLPTQAEILFLQKLNADGKIPSLFVPTTTNGYWAAGQLMYLKGSGGEDRFLDMTGATNSTDGETVRSSIGGTNYNGFVRCVYDTWYWGELHSSSTSGTWLGYKTSLSDTF